MNKMTKLTLGVLPALALWLGSTRQADAQWQTQSLLVKTGWTAVYLNVDLSYTNLDWLIGSDANNPIYEVWQWMPTAGSVQFVTSPQTPVTGSQWASWMRNGGVGASLVSMVPNAAYLIHSVAATNYTWNVKGKPVTPNFIWTTPGINLVGFSTVTVSPPPLDNFLSLVPQLQAVAQIYQYVGGNLGSNNPVQVFAPHTVPVTRGTAFWISSPGYYNNYFGPFQVALPDTGVVFGDSTSQNAFHLRNT